MEHLDIYSLDAPVLIGDFCFFLNAIGHRETGDQPVYINTVNFDTPVVYINNRWEPKENGSIPVTLVTHRAALNYGKYLGKKLLTADTWSVLANNALCNSALKNLEVITEEKTASPIALSDMDNLHPVFGNISFWGESIDLCNAWVFGIGWNKPNILTFEHATRIKVKTLSSVSTGIRYVR